MNVPFKAFIDLCRVSNLPTVWTNVLAALVLSGSRIAGADGALLAVSMSLLYTGGMCYNDVCDAGWDRIQRPDRPIPSGRITMKQARMFALVQFAGALLILAAYRQVRVIVSGIVLLALIVLYDRYHKEMPSSVLLMALCRSLIFITVSLAAAGSVSTPVAVAAVIQFLYVLLISVVARRENTTPAPSRLPVVPLMISGISLVDGLLMTVFASPRFLIPAAAGTALTYLCQNYVRGD